MRRSLRSWLWRVPLDQEVDEELSFHLEMRVRELVDQGMSPDEARAAARRRLGDVTAIRRSCMDQGRRRDRDMLVKRWLDELGRDVTFALRQLRASPGFALVAVVTVALGIGANSAMFALVDTALLRPLPLPAPDRLVMVWETSEQTSRSLVSSSNLIDLGDRSQTLEHLAGFAPGVGGMVMDGADGNAETVPRQWVTAGFFDVLGVPPLVGRTFQPADNAARASVVVLNEGFWRSRFGGDRSVVGREVRLDGDPYTVIGVVPGGLELLGQTSLWALAPIEPSADRRRGFSLSAAARLTPGTTLDQARAELNAIAAALAEEFPDTNRGRGVAIEPLHDALIGGDLRVTSLLFLGVVGVVLLICCANVANLLLARATARARELAIRSALGAGRRRVVRQLLTESLVLSAIGGVLGLGLGAAILRVAPSVVPSDLLPTAITLAFDLRIVAFCAVATLLVGVLFGVAPAWQATTLSPAHAMHADSRSVAAGGGRLRGLLVAGEVATAVLLLFGAGLLLRTLLAVEGEDRGYRAERVLTMMVDPLDSRYPTAESMLQFFDGIEREVRALPGVANVAWTTTLPLGTSETGPRFFEIMGDPAVEPSQRPSAGFQIVSPSYFDTVQQALVAGRGFSDRDTLAGAPVCIVNEAFVRRHLAGRSPIGVRVGLRSDAAAAAPGIVREIVGVVERVKSRPDEAEDPDQIYVPLAQLVTGDIYLAVRSATSSPEALAPAVRAAIGRIDRERLVSVREVTTLEEVAWTATGRHRFRAVLVVTFAGLALLLAMVGVFGILAYMVQQRERDIAVRRALGATTGDVLWMVAGNGAAVIAAGALAGLALSVVLGQSLTTMLFGVRPLDPLTFAAVAALLAVAGAGVTSAAAWRATRIDPTAALRES